MNEDPISQALRELRAAVEGVRADMRERDSEIQQLRDAVAERDARIRSLGEQAVQLLELLHEARANTIKQTPGAGRSNEPS